MVRVDAPLRVELAWSPAPRQVTTMRLTLPAGSTLADAIGLSGINTDGLQCGIWGRLRALDDSLRDGDRIELFRPLQVDPKEARRLRYKKQARRGKTPAPTGQ